VSVVKMARSWGWVLASVAAAWLGGSSVSRAQPAPHPHAQSAPASRPSSAAAAAPSRGDAAAEGVVNLNEATADELERLPGIGPAKARAIVEHRHGHPFHRVDELTKVKGIGRKTFSKLRPYLTLVGATTLMAQPAGK
jgi:competence protein ComEA